MAREADVAEVERRLRESTPYWAGGIITDGWKPPTQLKDFQGCAKIVDEQGEEVPFVYRPAQLKLDAALEAQRRAGKPMRAVVLKSRRIGISSSGMAKLVHRTTTQKNRRALIVGQDNDTPGELHEIARDMWARLPAQPEWLKPALMSERNAEGNRLLHFGSDRYSRRQGDLGVNSVLKIDTAKEVTAGRGKTLTDLWLTEMAAWKDPSKGLSLLNAVFDNPTTLIVMESTAMGHNAFKGRVDRAERGEGSFAFVFVGWLDDDEHCRLPFDDPDQLAQFLERVGRGEWGSDEPMLLRRMHVPVELDAKFDRGVIDFMDPVHVRALEFLHWRWRIGIPDKCDGHLEHFMQEYPSTPAEAFIASGKNVFSMSFVQRAIDAVQETDGEAEVGTFIPSAVQTKQVMHGSIEVPTGALWVPQSATGFAATDGMWRIWRRPCGCWIEDSPDGCDCATKPAGTAGNAPLQHLMGVDVSEGHPDGDWHSAELIDHVTGQQVAEYRSRVNPDLLTYQVLLAALHYHLPWVLVEVTGGYGLPIARDLQHKFMYPRVFTRKRVESTREKSDDRLGWSTNLQTKPMILSLIHRLLREDTHGLRSLALCLEMQTYVHHEDGSQGADADAYDDLLMAWGIAQVGRTEIPVADFSTLPPAGGGHRAPRRPSR